MALFLAARRRAHLRHGRLLRRTRRPPRPVLWVVFLSHALAAVLVVAVVGLDRNADPTRHDIVIGIIAGVIGMISVALF